MTGLGMWRWFWSLISIAVGEKMSLGILSAYGTAFRVIVGIVCCAPLFGLMAIIVYVGLGFIYLLMNPGLWVTVCFRVFSLFPTYVEWALLQMWEQVNIELHNFFSARVSR